MGKGLEALLGNPVVESAAPDNNAGDTIDAGTIQSLPVEYLNRGKYQPRRDMDPTALQELADSIDAQGLMQPIVVRPIGQNRYEIIAGERRWRAAQLAGLAEIPSIVKDIPDESAIAMALIENIQRENLNAMEEAIALQRLQDEFSMTQQQVASAVGKSRSAVANLLRMNNLTPDVKTLLEHGDLELGHAKVLLALDGGEQVQVARTVVAKSLNVRQTEQLVKQQSQHQPVTTDNKPNNDVKKLEDQLSDQLGVPVSIQHNAKGNGKLTLKYNSLDELDGILEHIK